MAKLNHMKSSNYLFHYTCKLKNVFSIIENGIWVKRCVEDFSFLEDVMPELDIEAFFGNSSLNENQPREEKKYKLCIPMACFCDIPIQQSVYHSEIYGKYAIGFDKNWGIKRGINPVIYLIAESDLATVMRKLNNLTQKLSPSNPDYAIRNAFFKLASFLKPYEGFYKKDDYCNKDHRFYDEREWRYLIKGYYDKIAPPEEFDDPEETRPTLDILLKDVRYIIVETDAEIENVSKHFSLKGITLEKYFPDLEVTSFESINSK